MFTAYNAVKNYFTGGASTDATASSAATPRSSSTETVQSGFLGSRTVTPTPSSDATATATHTAGLAAIRPNPSRDDEQRTPTLPPGFDGQPPHFDPDTHVPGFRYSSPASTVPDEEDDDAEWWFTDASSGQFDVDAYSPPPGTSTPQFATPSGDFGSSGINDQDDDELADWFSAEPTGQFAPAAHSTTPRFATPSSELGSTGDITDEEDDDDWVSVGRGTPPLFSPEDTRSFTPIQPAPGSREDRVDGAARDTLTETVTGASVSLRRADELRPTYSTRFDLETPWGTKSIKYAPRYNGKNAAFGKKRLDELAGQTRLVLKALNDQYALSLSRVNSTRVNAKETSKVRSRAKILARMTEFDIRVVKGKVRVEVRAGNDSFCENFDLDTRFHGDAQTPGFTLSDHISELKANMQHVHNTNEKFALASGYVYHQRTIQQKIKRNTGPVGGHTQALQDLLSGKKPPQPTPRREPPAARRRGEEERRTD